MEHLNLLGKRVQDRVTGAEGVVTSVCFDLYGCIQAIVHRGLKPDGEPYEASWFDVGRLAVLSDTPVIQAPDFKWTPQAISEGRKGPEMKPPCGRF